MNRKAHTEFAGQVRMNQQKLASKLRKRFDYIVCGAGTSGCVVAARLASDRDRQVLLLEAGGTDETELVSDPNSWPKTLGSDLDWGFVAEPNANLNGRAIRYSMGKVLGGGSGINVSTWSRGHQADWDSYAFEADDVAWSYEAVLDLYQHRIEAWSGVPDPQYRRKRCRACTACSEATSLCFCPAGGCRVGRVPALSQSEWSHDGGEWGMRARR